MTPNAVKIRKFRLSDLNDIMKIMQTTLPDLYKNSANPKIMPNIYYIVEKWNNRLGRCTRKGSLRFLFTDIYDRITLVAEYSNNIVGFIQGFPITDEEWLINAIGVLSDYRRKGIGRKLVKELISCLRRRGWKKVVLYVESDNIPAIRFYKKLGFKEVKRRKICMLLNIDGFI